MYGWIPKQFGTIVLFNPFLHNYTFWRVWERSFFKNIVGKGRIACISNFSLSYKDRIYQRQKLSFLLHLICRLHMLLIWSGPKFQWCGNGLMSRCAIRGFHSSRSKVKVTLARRGVSGQPFSGINLCNEIYVSPAKLAFLCSYLLKQMSAEKIQKKKSFLISTIFCEKRGLIHL